MIADQTFFKNEASSNAFTTPFKPVATRPGFQGNVSGTPFVPEMPQKFTRPTQFNMTPEFKSFVPQTGNVASFTPVSPVLPSNHR